MKTFVKLMTLIVLFSLIVSCGGTPATTERLPPQPACSSSHCAPPLWPLCHRTASHRK